MMKAVSVGRCSCCSGRAPEQRVDRERHRLQLQGDVGQRAGHRDDGDDGGHRLALAVARGEEVGDRGDVLALGEPHDAQQEAPAEREQQDRPEIDREEVVARGGGEADAAEERPGRAVDGQRQGIDRAAGRCRPCASGRSGRRTTPARTGCSRIRARARRRSSLRSFDLRFGNDVQGCKNAARANGCHPIPQTAVL